MFVSFLFRSKSLMANFTNNTSAPYDRYGVSFSIPAIAIVIWLMLPLPSVVNILALLAYRNISRKLTVYFLRNLAVVYLMTCVPYIMFYAFNYEGTCAMILFGNTLIYNVAVAVSSTLILVIDQSIAIIKPLRYRVAMTTSKAIFAIAMCWFIPAFGVYGFSVCATYINYKIHYPETP